ncbi:MAG: methyltransferase domain-containing protein, partial [Eubacteriales bacterium]|nr:methyltransferase domain-containing protein [Eubacteriales bacterium]
MSQEYKINSCSLGGICGGCFYCNSPYEAQLYEKEERVKGLLDQAVSMNIGGAYEYNFEGIVSSPLLFAYRNKMEYSFGDCQKDGPLTLGLHKKKSFYDVIDVDCCELVHEDCNLIVRAAASYFRELQLTYTDKRTHLGYLRYLIIRRAVNTGEMLIDLVTTSQPLIPVGRHADIYDVSLYAPETFAVESRNADGIDAVAPGANADGVDAVAPGANAGVVANADARGIVAAGGRKKRGRGRGSNALGGLVIVPGKVAAAEGVKTLDEDEVLSGFTERLLNVAGGEGFEGRIRGILHTVNDAFADAVRNDGTTVLFGEDHIAEELLGLKFEISPFSFFQTNSKGAEVLYSKVREYIADELNEDMSIFDLYSGTGTIAQLLAPCVREVTGVEIVPEAVDAARVNAAANGLDNCRFIADDVLAALDSLPRPDAIILDPPRDGVNAKALQKIIAYGVENMIYVSCKPESLARDLGMLQGAGYRLVKATAVDQFPWTNNVETVCLLSKLSGAKHSVDV